MSRTALTVMACALLAPASTSFATARLVPEHQAIQQYNGPSTCVACHSAEASDMFHAVHYQQTGPTPNVPNIPGNAGKLDYAMNTYCGSPMSSRQYACFSCHVSYGKLPRPVLSPEQLNNIDCMMCHQDLYLRKPAGPSEQVPFTDYLGNPRVLNLPVETNGDFALQPDSANMTISPLEAARTVHRPTRKSCLRCHAYAAGTNCGKRGDLSSANENPPIDIDYHMSPQGRNQTCQACHQPQNHRFLGRGLDLRENDRPESLTCTLCHSSTPHGDEFVAEASELDRHAARIACQTCHIPTYARAMSTEVERDWTHPIFFQSLFGGQGGWKPEELRASNLTPTYRWYDGTSYVYVLGQTPPLGPGGDYEFGLPNGSAVLTGGQIYPMKEHWGNAARHDATGQIVPHSTGVFFATGDFNQAVDAGMAWAGLSGPWTLVSIHTFQTINHGVVRHDFALACGQCHASMPGGPVRMDLKGALGYGLKGPVAQICTQCHGSEPMPSFTELHDKHVTDKHFDCRWCHTFSRPERQLTMPQVDKPGDMNCDGAVTFADIDPFVTALGGAAPYYATYSCNWMNGDTNGDHSVNFADIDSFVGLFGQ